MMTENRLSGETSPYLLQHRNNPVHWWPWGPEAFAKARASGKPVLLSIGYAACHWCHVMAHESFENEEIAALMNALFINIKVDREERPDVDQIYMSALHHMGQQGGWPLTMFLDGEGHPFWGGTYFPPHSRYGRPGFTDVLKQISAVYHEDPAKVRQSADALRARLEKAARPPGTITISREDLSSLGERLTAVLDPVHGGLKGAPKFPQCSLLEFLWRSGTHQKNDALTQPVIFAIHRMSEGGIYDHLGGGFARYAVDDAWLVPHFEKMLYDNAQLLELLALAGYETHDPLYLTRAQETVEWLEREMMSPEGAFTASLDADSEGEEGRFYVWSAEEISAILGPDDAAFFGRFYDVTRQGNWEGHTILNRTKAGSVSLEDEARLAPLRAKLLKARARRVRPGRDDKVLADWNGLMIGALARTAVMLGQGAWIALARRAFDAICTHMMRDGRLGHSLCGGKLVFPGLSSDLAAMARAAIALHEATGETAFLDRARQFLELLEEHHLDAASGTYFLTADDAEALIMRPLSSHDEALPNPNAVAADALLRLSALLDDELLRARADRILAGLSGAANRNVLAHGATLNALDTRFTLAQITVVGTGAQADALAQAALALPFPLRVVRRVMDMGKVAPDSITAARIASAPAEGAAFICVGENCTLPVTDPEKLKSAILNMQA
ncbi:thioredoxin domain-containing protein [Xanthobacter sp. TB0136]|uniref:thioredoxin domain-containing protein n=1 Tax=Xanthobacter sp. TB0136 TaxID=3459177 RepID=UPI004039CB60